MLHVDVWSDVACPWCYVGKRRFEAAVAAFDEPVEITWRSYQLSPNHPQGVRENHDEMLARKYGRSLDDVKQMNERLVGLAAAEGLNYDFDAYTVVNTRDAHRLSHMAAARGLGDQMHERLFSAQLERGELIDDPEVLARIGEEVGIPAADVLAMLASDEFADEVARDIAEAQAIGVSGVPFFVFNRRLAVSGAQPTEVFTQALNETRAALADADA